MIDFFTGAIFQFNNCKGSNAGEYHPQGDYIKICKNIIEEQGQDENWAVYHEIGHWAYKHKMSDNAKQVWKKLWSMSEKPPVDNKELGLLFKSNDYVKHHPKSYWDEEEDFAETVAYVLTNSENKNLKFIGKAKVKGLQLLIDHWNKQAKQAKQSKQSKK